MNKHLDLPTPVPSGRLRRIGVAALLNASTLLATSTPVAAAEPKLPRYVGD